MFIQSRSHFGFRPKSFMENKKIIIKKKKVGSLCDFIKRKLMDIDVNFDYIYYYFSEFTWLMQGMVLQKCNVFIKALLTSFGICYPKNWRIVNVGCIKPATFFPKVQIFCEGHKILKKNLPFWFDVAKAHVFWEGHKNFTYLRIFIWHYLVTSNYKWKMGQIFVAFTDYLKFKK